MANLYKVIPKNTKVNPLAKQLFLKGGKQAVILFHGFRSSPLETQYISQRLYDEGFTVFAVRTAGHGTNSQDFLATSWKDWLRKSAEAYLDLNSEYEDISVLGISMGGILACLVSEIFNPRKVILAAPGLKVAESYSFMLKLSPFIGIFVKKIKKKNPKVFEDENRKYLASQYSDYEWPSKSGDLIKLQKLAIKNLNMIYSDTLTIVSKKDTMISQKVVDIINDHVSGKKKTVVLEKSSHELLTDIEKEKVAAEAIDWLKK